MSGDAYDSAEDDAYPVGPSFTWLIYLACETCGAQAKKPCIGEGVRFGPHEGRRPHWQREQT